MFKNYNYKVGKCRSCDYKLSDPIFSLKKMVPTGQFKKTKINNPKIDLSLALCKKCKLLQLSRTTDPKILYSDYWYLSGTNKTMTDHLHNLAKSTSKKVKIKNDDYILDIGCNDGTLLNYFFKYKKINLVGIDPSKNPLTKVNKRKINLINNYFSKENLINKIPKHSCKIITSISMFYDIDNPKNFIDDVKYFLNENGIWVVEMNYLGDMIKNLKYDMIGHEHLTYYSIYSFNELIKKCGLYISDITYNEINGGSVRLFVSKKIKNENLLKKELKKESKIRLNNTSTYKSFFNRILRSKKSLTNTLSTYKKNNKKIAIIGASTRGNTILQFCKFPQNTFIGASDRNPLKDGLYMAGSNIKIFNEQRIRDLKPDVMFVLPYFYEKELINRELDYLKQGGSFIVPLPKPFEVFYKKGKIQKKYL